MMIDLTKLMEVIKGNKYSQERIFDIVFIIKHGNEDCEVFATINKKEEVLDNPLLSEENLIKFLSDDRNYKVGIRRK